MKQEGKEKQKMNTEMKELNLEELERVNGGIIPFIIAGVVAVGTAAYGIYKGCKALSGD